MQCRLDVGLSHTNAQLTLSSSGLTGLWEHSDDRGLIGFLVKLAEQILLHGRSKTGPTSRLSPLYPGRGEEPAAVAVTRCIRGSNNSALPRRGPEHFLNKKKTGFKSTPLLSEGFQSGE